MACIVTRYVDPFIGVDWPGNGLCGPYLPRSLVRLGPDCVPPVDTTGYVSGRAIRHFSHTHLSGTGGGGRYGNLGVMPFTGLPRLSLDAAMPEAETAACGYYSVLLQPMGIRAELTSTPRAGVHRYTFPEGAEANVLLDLGAVIQVANNTPGEWTGASIGGFVEFISETEIVGRADCRGGWGHKFPYSVHMFARFDRPVCKRLVGNQVGIIPGIATDGPNCRAVASFGACREVGLQVGVSFVSLAQARRAVEVEVAGRSFEAVRTAAAETWGEALGRVRVEGGTDDQKRLFYTLFTRLLAMPSDLGIDDEFGYWHSGVRQFTDIVCLWDSVRNANSLLTLIEPEFEADLLNSLLDIGEHLGWIPDAWIAGHSAMIQGGSSADILFCEAALKKLPGIDYARALKQMRKNNEVESPDPWMYGRYLREYRDLGYLPAGIRQCVSRHLEYAYQDWCIGRLAQELGDTEVATRQFASAGKLWNLWRDDLKCFAPKRADGRWVEPINPEHVRADSWNDPHFYEGTARQWSFSAHQDFAGLVARHGGPEAFVAHLDRFFATGQYHPKETQLHVPFLYHYAGRPDLSSARARACLAKYFRVERKGLNDNEDMGCQSAFYMCTALGLYPIMGQDLYLLTAPVFARAEIAMGQGGRTLVIEAPGAGPERGFIIGATLNGKPLERAWLRHGEIAAGAVLRLELAAQPTSWGVGTAPPSAAGL